MRLTHGSITQFKPLMDELFYDWIPCQEVFMLKESVYANSLRRGYYVNKTSVFEEDGQYFMNYKMNTYSLTPLVFETFKKFYSLYVGDTEFAEVLNTIANHWDSVNMETIKVSTGGIEFENFKMEEKDGEYFLTRSDSATITGPTKRLSSSTFHKTLNFFHLLTI